MSNIQLSGERPAEGSRSKKKLKRRSEVWEHFDETPDGQRAICKYCSKSLSGKSSGGTSHLKRHFHICDKCPKGDITQQVTVDLRDEVTNIGMTQKETWQETMVKKAILAEIPFASSDSKKNCYRLLEPMDVEKEIYAYYEHEKENLAIELNNLTSGVCLSIDIMEGFLSLTAHFINADFDLVKKLIGFKKLPDPSHTTIINMLEKCLSEWKLEEKIFTFTAKGFYLDVMKSLKEKFSSKMILGGRDISVPCCKEKLEEFCYEMLDDICDVKCRYNSTEFFDALTAIPSRIDTFNQIANERGLPPINEGWFQYYAECNHWLNLDSTSVLRILKKMFSYKDVFSQYCTLSETGQPLHWQRLQLTLNFSGQVNCILNGLSSFKHPTSHLYSRNILEIYDTIDNESEDIFVDNVYDLLFNLMYCNEHETLMVAGALDPRYKLCFLQYWNDTEFTDLITTEEIMSDYRKILDEYFSEYRKEEANNISSSLVGTINTQDEGSSNNNTYLCPPTLTNRFSQHIRERTELDKYLREEVIDIGVEDFDLLGWWKQNQSRFPVLSRMARDILAVPACVYSTKGTIQSDLKSLEGVDPQLLEAVICSKDWILAREQRDVSEPKN